MNHTRSDETATNFVKIKNHVFQKHFMESISDVPPCCYCLQYILPVDGSYLSWGEWSSCTTSCGLGNRYTLERIVWLVITVS